MSESSILALNKLILLYFIEKMDLPLSNNQIIQMVMEKNYMDYFNVQVYLKELTDVGFLDVSKSHNITKYTVTEEGSKTLYLFIRHLPDQIKNELNLYIKDNKKNAKEEFEVASSYFKCINGEFLIKCGVYDESGNSLLEVSAMLASKNQAKMICENWKNNIEIIYSKIFELLTIEKDLSAEMDSSAIEKDF